MTEKADYALPLVDCVDLDIMHTTAQEQLPVFAADSNAWPPMFGGRLLDDAADQINALLFPHLPSGRVDEVFPYAVP